MFAELLLLSLTSTQPLGIQGVGSTTSVTFSGDVSLVSSSDGVVVECGVATIEFENGSSAVLNEAVGRSGVQQDSAAPNTSWTVSAETIEFVSGDVRVEDDAATVEIENGRAVVVNAPAGKRAAQEDDAAPKTSWTVSAERVYTVSGDVIENGAVTVEDGRIVAVGPAAGKGDIHVAAITPGLVDLGARISLSDDAVEQSAEATPNMRITDAWNPYSVRFGREAKSGVTTVLMTPPANNVIGGLSAAVKTAGDPATRAIKADVALNGAIGSMPSSGNSPAFQRVRSMFNRRPTTRMGVEWVARKAFYEAITAREAPEAEIDLDAEGVAVLQRVLDGELPLMLQASATQDVRTSIFLAEEFGLQRLIIESAAEAWKEPDMLERSGAAVVLPPFAWEGRTDIDAGFLAWNTAAMLEQRGIAFALSGHGSADRESRMMLQPAFAVRGGASPKAALAAATLVPAQMVGIDDRVGSIEVGKDADLCLWNGVPTSFTSDVIGVLVSGELVLDPGTDSQHKARSDG